MKFAFIVALLVLLLASFAIAATNMTANTTDTTSNGTAPPVPVATTMPLTQAVPPSLPPVPSGLDPVFIAVNVALAACILFIISRHLTRNVV